MKTLFTIVSIACSLFSIEGNSQITFQKKFSGHDMEHGRCVQSCPDGGYILSGNTTSFWMGNAGYLIKTDSMGTPLWTKTVRGPVATILEETIVLPDSGFISVGETEDMNTVENLFICRLDANGDTVWTKTFSSSDDLFGYDIVVSPAGGYFIVALCNGTVKQMYVLYLNESGDTIWTRHSSASEHYSPKDMVATADGGIIIAAEFASLSGDFKMSLTKMDSTGNVSWSKNYGKPVYDYITYAVEETSDNGFIISGALPGSGSVLIRTDANGDTLWTRTYKATYGHIFLMDILSCDDNGILACGQIAGHNQAIFLKTDSAGDTLWTNAYRGTLTQFFNYSGERSAEYFFSGTAYDSSGNQDIIFFKTDMNGRTGCDDTCSIEYTSTLTLQMTSVTPFFVPGGLTETQIAITSGNGYISNDLCITPGINEITREYITVYPNPSQGLLHLKFSDGYSNENLVIFNSLGEIILVKDVKNISSMEIDLSDQVPGIYLVRLENGNRFQTARICLTN